MSVGKIGVGIVGLSPGQGWAQRAHLPALLALPEYAVNAVANSSLASAEAAALSLHIPKAFADVASLADAPSVDLVAVTVKVPHHREMVMQALGARKMVYCEWPLGNGLAEAEAMADAARSAGVRTLVGLQARSSPVIRYVRDLIRDGYLGDVLSTTLVGSGGLWGAQVSGRDAYTHDRVNGANLLTIPFGHTIDALCHCLGEFSSVSATMAMRRKTYVVARTDEERPMATEDQVVVSGELEAGTVVSAHYRGGSSRGTNLRWEINGTLGDLEVTAGSGHLQLSELMLRGARGEAESLQDMPIPARYRLGPAGLTGGAINVGEAYLQFAMDDRATYDVPGFDAALSRHRLLFAIEQSARTGERVKP